MDRATQINEPLSSVPVVSVKGLTFSLHDRVMLSGLDCSLNFGECLSVVGPNGAGKTTLLRVLCGLYRSYQGSARIANREVKGERVDDLARMVSLVPQRMEFLPGFTVGEFIELSGAGHQGCIAGLIGDLEQRLLPELSGGELQRVIIAGAVAQGVKLLLLDEPTANLDPAGRSEVERVLRLCREELGVSYILVTHDISLALRCCSRMVIMANGAATWQGASDDRGIVERLESAYSCGFARLDGGSKLGSVVVPM